MGPGGSRRSRPESPVSTSGFDPTTGRSTGETHPSASAPTSAPSGSPRNGSGIFASSATLLPLRQRLVCCIHRLNPQPFADIPSARKRTLHGATASNLRERSRIACARLYVSSRLRSSLPNGPHVDANAPVYGCRKPISLHQQRMASDHAPMERSPIPLVSLVANRGASRRIDGPGD